MEKKVFRSRISVLLIIFVLGCIIPPSIPMFAYKEYGGLYITGGVFVFIAFLFTGMRYVISDGKLYLKMWIIPNGSANITDIVSVERTYNPLSSPAGSLKRLCIHFRQGARYTNWMTWLNTPSYWLISPVREQEFIEELKAINPYISVNVPIQKGIWRIWDWDV